MRYNMQHRQNVTVIYQNKLIMILWNPFFKNDFRIIQSTIQCI